MRTIGLKPGDMTLVLERRGDQLLAHNALVIGSSMLPALAGAQGEMSIEAAFVVETPFGIAMPKFEGIVHVSHMDWQEGRAGLAYEEIPAPSGVCRFCLCTEHRACPGGCQWLDADATICSAPACEARFRAVDYDRGAS